MLRVYNNGLNSARVVYEHAVLEALRASGRPLSFALPRALPSLGDGPTHVRLAGGAEACLFELIPGRRE